MAGRKEMETTKIGFFCKKNQTEYNNQMVINLYTVQYWIKIKFQGENCGREALHWKQTVINFHSRPL